MLNDFSIRDFNDWTRVQNREGGERKSHGGGFCLRDVTAGHVRPSPRCQKYRAASPVEDACLVKDACLVQVASLIMFAGFLALTKIDILRYSCFKKKAILV